MLDAFIINKIKKEEEREPEQWQPVPLPLESPEIIEDSGEENTRKITIVEIRF